MEIKTKKIPCCCGYSLPFCVSSAEWFVMAKEEKEEFKKQFRVSWFSRVTVRYVHVSVGLTE
jgi:gamma-glutamyl:cysteine ligase YbdK (ATP-grasp superfamily)